MKKTVSFVAMIATFALAISAVGILYARGGGGGHMGGGGHAGGGWSGGRGGGDWSRGGGEFERGGEHHYSGENHGAWQHDRDDRQDRDHGDHDRRHNNDNNNNNNNNGNTTNNVNVYGPGNEGWGWGWGAADDAIAGVAVGAAIASAANQQPTVIVEQPSTTVIQQTVQAPTYGTQVTTLPAGCSAQNIHGTMAYQCGSVWYRPYFGSSGVYYEVVPPPPSQPAGN